MQVKSRQRVADHGEVYTAEREVNAMLDLVADQVINPQKTFLEPACGTGNFLAVILQRRLNTIYQKHKKIQYDYELNAITAISTLYGIELLPDNVAECRERLLTIFQNHYTTHFKKANPRCLDVARFFLSKNILCGDALTFKQNDGLPIIFCEWKFRNSLVKRRDYIYQDLHDQITTNNIPKYNDQGQVPYIAHCVKDDYAEVLFLELSHE